MKKYEYVTYQRLDLQGNSMKELGEQGWKLMDVRHNGCYSWADSLLFMRRKK